MPECQKNESTRPKTLSPAEKRSIHDGVETWDDCCVCEAEPRWQQLGEELEESTGARGSEGQE